MQVMTRAEAYANRKVKIVSNSREAPADASFFARSPPDASSFQSQGSHAAYVERIQMEDVLALDLFTGFFCGREQVRHFERAREIPSVLQYVTAKKLKSIKSVQMHPSQ